MEGIDSKGLSLLKARKKKRMTQQNLADMFGVDIKTIRNWEKGGVIPSTRMPMVEDFINSAFNDSLVQASDDVEEVTVNSHGNKFMQTPSGMLMEVPVVPFAAMGSPLDEFAELIRDNGFEHVSFPVDGVHRGSYYAFRVEGDSMDDGTRDSFQPGDIVLVRELDRSDWAPRLHFGKWPYWVICWGNCVRLKQITAQDEAGSTITCHSLNPSPEFTDFTLRLSDVHRLFNVIQVVPKPRVFSFT